MSDQRPAEYLQLGAQDATQHWPGAPPNWGQPVIPHILTVAGQAGLAGMAYLNADEALMHDPANAERMRADCGIMECIEARERAVALLNWHIEPEDDKSNVQRDLAKELQKITARTPRFAEMRRWLSEAIWYGRNGAAMQYASKEIGGQRRIAVSRWEPRNGDKFVFRYDDGSGKYDPEQIGIKIGIGGVYQGKLYEAARRQGKIEYTNQGMVYWFDRMERKLLLLHKHMVEDGPYDDVRLSGRIHGVGIRTRIYWTWYAMVECLQRALQYLDRAAFGIELWRYPANSPKAKADTERAAKRAVSGGRAIVLVPVPPGEMADLYGVEHIEPGLQGVDRLLQVIKDFFQMKIKRYVLGQTLTSEAEATGLGSGVADAHMATFADIVEYDAVNLEETLTVDFVQHIQAWNFPQYKRHWMQFKIDTESPDVERKLKALKSVWDMGARVKASDLCDAAGISLPTELDAQVFNPQIVGAMEQLGIAVRPGAGPVSNPNDPMALAIRNALSGAAANAAPERMMG